MDLLFLLYIQHGAASFHLCSLNAAFSYTTWCLLGPDTKHRTFKFGPGTKKDSDRSQIFSDCFFFPTFNVGPDTKVIFYSDWFQIFFF